MRVTLVNHRYLPFRGGSELYIQKLAERLASKGVYSRVVTTDAFDLEYFWDPAAKAVDALSRECKNGVEVERLSIRHPPLSRLLFPVSRRGMGEASRFVPATLPFELVSRVLPRMPGLLSTLLSAGRQDIVVASNLGLEGLAIVASQAAAKMGSAFVLLPFAHIGDGSGAIAHRYVSMPHHRELVQQADLSIALTELEAKFLEELGANRSRIVVAGAGVDLPADGCFPSTPKAEDRSPPFSVLSIGAMARDKGTMDLVEASRLLWNRGVRHTLTLVGPEMRSFSDWFRSTGAANCRWIECRGVVDEAEKRALLSSADVLALPSRTESFGIVYLEAWSYRKPVIGAAVGAVSEVIDDGVDGLLAPFGYPAAIADAIERLASNPEFAECMGRAGFAKVERSFTWDRVLERIEEGFRTVLGIDAG